MTHFMGNRKQGSPYNCGWFDAYHGRRCNPHWWPRGHNLGKRIEEWAMTKEQIAEYKLGYNNQPDRRIIAPDGTVRCVTVKSA